MILTTDMSSVVVRCLLQLSTISVITSVEFELAHDSTNTFMLYGFALDMAVL